MQKQRILGVTALLLATGLAMGLGAERKAEQVSVYQEKAAYAQLLAATRVAGVDGKAVSPDGKFAFRTAGETDIYVSGLRPPEKVQLVDTATGEVLWEADGTLRHSVCWAADSSKAALVTAGRTWNRVTVIETENLTAWDVVLPNESSLPEYTFLPQENWGRWENENVLYLTTDGSDGETPRTYRCHLRTEYGQLTGSSLEEQRETLPGEYDFDHDGAPETLELVTLLVEDRGGRLVAWYELWVKSGGETLWPQIFSEAHVGWASIFALSLDGQDYLLRYDPYMGQGAAAYHYQIFSLDAEGQEMLLRENGVEFDINFGSPVHQSYDPKSIADFLYDVHGYLDQSVLLVSTEDGALTKDISGADFRSDDFHGGEILNSDDWEEALREYQKIAEEERA